MGFLLRAGQILLGAAIAGVGAPSCYSAGAGSGPPPQTFYFPVGLAVSADGTVLYAANSDFDLQWNGGTLQSYNLSALRGDAADLIQQNLMAGNAGCLNNPPDGGVPLGEGCAPPRPSQHYFQDSAIIGAFATDIQLSTAKDASGNRRLFVPVRGNATLTWADISHDSPSTIQCGKGSDGRCDAAYQAGHSIDPGNTRASTMPGEPFGMAQTEDGTAVAITHQTDTKTSLLLTGFGSDPNPAKPSMQFVLDGLPTGGIGIAAIPHDPDLLTCPSPMVARPAFLETNRSVAEIDLLRLYDDNGSSPNHRPFLQREGVFPITSNAIGTDSRGIVIDPTPRLACKALPGADVCACAQLPARVFFASRTPPALGIGLIGGPPPSGGGTFDPDRLILTGNVPLPPGPSNLYLAPIVDRSGKLALRVFVVCYDASQIVVYDPEAQAVENIINVGPGPFAMAFDPFLDDKLDQTRWGFIGKALNDPSLPDAVSKYRFAYVASFLQSYVQMIDLDNSQPTADTFERVVFTLGQPTKPKGQ